jgi:glycosyltransferase involved in cell wall biosynthesis
MLRRPIRVLHFAPHYGGGVGTVVRALVSESCRQGGFEHRLACLEYLNDRMTEWTAAEGVLAVDRLWGQDEALRGLLADADIVHLHWWHHPLLNDFMHRPDWPPFRCILWSHVNGHYPPQNFPLGLADYPDILALATPWSRKAPALAQPLAKGEVDIRVIQSCAGVPTLPERTRSADGVFRVGYIGTVDAAKMHPDFVQLCLATGLLNTRFIVAGGPRHEVLRRQVVEAGVEERFDILGPIEDALHLMVTLDVFGYPLNTQHYGTGEQVLLEAMAAGAVPVVLDTGCERYIVDDGRTGLVCADEREYVRALRQLHANRPWLEILAQQAQEWVAVRFSIRETVNAWHVIYEEGMSLARRLRFLQGSTTLAPVESHSLNLLLDAWEGTMAGRVLRSVVTNGLESWGEQIRQLPVACFSDTRGSLFHYQSCFPDDVPIAKLCSVMREAFNPVVLD